MPLETRIRTKQSRPKAPLTMPGLYQRGRTYWLKFYVDGRPRRESLRTDDLSLAIQKADILRRTPAMEPSGRWKAEVQTYAAERQRQDRLTAEVGRTRVYALVKEGARMGWTQPARVTTPMIQSWYEELRRTNTENTALTYVTFLRSFYAWLLEKGKVRENPVALVKLARNKPAPRRNFVSRENVRRLIEQCEEPQLKFILYCGFHAGLRKGEINAVAPDWIHLGEEGAGGRIDVRIRPRQTNSPKDKGWRPKSRRERSVPLTAEFRAFLASGEIDLTKKFVLMPHVKEGRARYRYDFREPLQQYFERFGVDATAHDMRRTFASLKVMAGASLVKVAKWLGDSYQVTFEHYSCLVPDKDKDIEIGL
jgi:integrase